MMDVRCARILARLRGDRRGAIAAEVALLALPIILTVLAIVEIGIMLVSSVTLHGALEEGARRLRTGEVQEAGDPVDQRQVFVDTVCGELYLMQCDELVFDVRHAGTYGALNMPSLSLDPTTGLPNNATFDPGGPAEITAARVYGRYHFVTPLLGHLFHDGHGGRLLSYAAVVKGEPWD